MQSEAQLIAAAQQDLAAFDALYTAYAPRVFGYLYSRVRVHSEAEELTAQTFLAALEQLPRYKHKGHFAAWLFAIARNKAVNTFRSRPMEDLDAARQIAQDTDVLLDVAQSEQLDALRTHIAALPDDQAELLQLRFVADLSFADIAELLGRTEGAVKKSVYRCLDRLQRQLEVEHV
ncbi:MAG: RNA polymerase sigma factor [Anaerolineales bacterium]|nr:RNA polymerase sigma factor [Anaerolineales bacterium]